MLISSAIWAKVAMAMDIVYNCAIVPMHPVKKHLEKFGAPLGIQAIFVAPYAALTLPGIIAVLSDHAFEFAMSQSSGPSPTSTAPTETSPTSWAG